VEGGKYAMRGGKRLSREKKRPSFRVQAVSMICAVILIAGGALAVHIISDRKHAEQEFSRFHISSNYLTEGDIGSYTVADWGDGFDILLYNYEREDISQISSVDMTYQITAEHGEVSVKKQNGDTVVETDGAYSFGAELTTAYHILHVTPDTDVGEDDAITVTVQTTSPYQKTLAAKFQIQHYKKPDYTVMDQNDGTVLIRVNTNDYQDSMTVAWEPDKYSPDYTNVLMASWTDEAHIGHFPVSRDSTYELLFFKKTDDSFKDWYGVATMITLD